MHLTDNDRKLWFIMYGPSNSVTWAFHLNTGSPEDEEQYRNHLWVSFPGWVFFIPLPNLIAPFKKRIYPSTWDQTTIDRLGRNWYYKWANKRYGLSLSEGFLQLFFGEQTEDSLSDRCKSWFLPWTQWRFIHKKLFHADGSLHECLSDETKTHLSLEQRNEIRKTLNKMLVNVVDVDGEHVQVSLHIVELKWERGEKPFTWLKYFYKPMVTRRVEIEFSKPVGIRKDSWKGGLVSTSTTLQDGETAYEAFVRYLQSDRSRDNLQGIQIIPAADPLQSFP